MSPNPRDLLIRGGRVIDGTAAPAFEADVRVRDGAICEVGPNLEPKGEATFDATGCYVSPGFIESHTHYDGTMWWQSDLDPLPGYGVTSLVMGNCGFALAPLSSDPAVRDQVVGIFSFFEDIPEQPFQQNLPWDWSTWSEYKASLTSNVRVPANYATYVGHIALRLAVLGLEAWERAATADEVGKMVELLDDALSAGCLGLSTNFLDHDGQDRPVPSLHALDDEFRALFEVLARHPGTSLQVPIDSIMRLTAVDSLERLARLSEGLPIRMQWGGIPTAQWQKKLGLQAPLVEIHERFAAEGRDFWTGFMHAPITTTVGVERTLFFAQSGEFAWHEVVEAGADDAKLALLRDPEWRKRARESWDSNKLDAAPYQNPRPILLDNSANGAGPTGITLGEYADELGVHCSDAMAEWIANNGLQSTVMMPPWIKDEEMVIRLIRDPKSVGNISDAAAHGQMFCGAGDNMLLFTDYVRKQGIITVEEAVHVQTGKLADFFGFADRGTIAPGKRADIVVFDLDEIEHRPKRKSFDVPDGKGGLTWRWTRDAAPVRLTLVNGVATFEDGKPTGSRPGDMIGPTASAS